MKPTPTEALKTESVFALDMGTGSVIGVVGKITPDGFVAEHTENLPHSVRAVVDGQIEDIDAAAQAAATVKQNLEKKLGYTLENVYVAAAGRVLKTRRTSYDMDLGKECSITAEHVERLEREAIADAYDGVMSERADGPNFYGVGHSVVNYFADGYKYSAPVGHRAKVLSADMITTFLPEPVVESLYVTMQKADLAVAGMTLEPIAAMAAVIPPELRLLNLALVDIGAGTSDIAISDEGSVSAYTMATVAGDEITEAVMRALLVDFKEAQNLKHSAGSGEKILEYTDILGFAKKITPEEFKELLAPAVDRLAEVIRENITESNGGRSPMAVFLVGGGSKTPGIAPAVAKKLGLPCDKVAVGGSNYMKRTITAPEEFLGGEYATPMGIALLARGGTPGGRVVVKVGETERTLAQNTATSAIDLLLRCGYRTGDIMGRSGRSITCLLDGVSVTRRGELPSLARIVLNGLSVGLTAEVAPGDRLEFVPALNGRDAECFIKDIVADFEDVGAILLNGNFADPDSPVKEGDVIEVERIPRQKSADAEEELPKFSGGTKEIEIVLGKKNLRLPVRPDGPYRCCDLIEYAGIDPDCPQGTLEITVNGNSAGYSHELETGDRVEIFWKQHEKTVFQRGREGEPEWIHI